MKMNSYTGMMKRLVFLAALGAISLAQAAPIKTWTLPNGARVLFVESHAVPIVDLSVSLDAGARRDMIGKPGLAEMTCEMLTRGVASGAGQPALNEAEISDAIADIAANVDCSVDSDRAVMQLRTLSSKEQRDKAVALTARMLAHPSFPAASLDREKARAIADIKESDVKPGSIARKAFMKAIYGAHPYGQQPMVETIEQINQDDLRAFHRRHYAAANAVVAIVGDVSEKEAQAIAQTLTKGLSPVTKNLSALPAVAPQKPQAIRIAHPASQAHILMGMPATTRGDPDFFAISVGNYILGGGGFVSRLMNEVREKRGMAYSVRSSFSPMKQAGPFQIGLQTKKEQADQAVAVVKQTLNRFLRDGPTPAELKAAKDNMLGGFALNIDTNSKMLATVSVIGYYDLPLDYLETWKRNVAKVSAADVRAAFQRRLNAEQMATVIVGSPK